MLNSTDNMLIKPNTKCKMKTLFLLITIYFLFSNISNSQVLSNDASLRQCLDYSKQIKIPVLINTDKFYTDSLDVLINEKYDLNGVRISTFELSNCDSLIAIKWLNFFKPISENVYALFYSSSFKLDVSQFNNIERLIILGEGALYNPSISLLKSVTEVGIDPETYGVTMKIDSQSNIFDLTNVMSIHLNVTDSLFYHPDNILQFKKLSELFLYDYKLKQIPETWSGLVSLKSCFLRCSVMDSSLNILMSLPTIENLQIQNLDYCPEINFNSIREIRNLQNFYLLIKPLNKKQSRKIKKLSKSLNLEKKIRGEELVNWNIVSSKSKYYKDFYGTK